MVMGRYQEVRHAELNQKRQALLRERLQGLSAVPETAQPTMFLLVGEVTHRQLADGGSPSGISGGSRPRQRRPAQALIMIRRPPEDLEEVQEGQVYSVTGLQPDKSAMRAGSRQVFGNGGSPALQLRASKRAQWQLQSSPSLGQWLSWQELPRQQVALQGLARLAPGSTFDFTGVVCKAGQLYRGEFSQWIFLADASITTPSAMAAQTSDGQQAQQPQQPLVQGDSGGSLLPGTACRSGGSCGRKRKFSGPQQLGGEEVVGAQQEEQPMEQRQQQHGEELEAVVQKEGQCEKTVAAVQAAVQDDGEQGAFSAVTLPCCSPSGQPYTGGVPAHRVGPASGEARQAEVAPLEARQAVASQADGQAAATTSRAVEPEACACPEAGKDKGGAAVAAAAEAPLHDAGVEAETAGVPVAGGGEADSHSEDHAGAGNCAVDPADITGVPTQPMISDGEAVAAAPAAAPCDSAAMQRVEDAAGKEVGAAKEPLRDAHASAAASLTAICLAAKTEATAAQPGQAPFGQEQAPVAVGGAALSAGHQKATAACQPAAPAFNANQPWLLAVRLVGTHEAVSWVDPGDEGSVFTFRDLQLWGQHDVPNRLWKAEGSQRTAVIR
ncbi:hypothetical protein N2152v2_010475 [Parachlorella kessleri]